MVGLLDGYALAARSLFRQMPSILTRSQNEPPVPERHIARRLLPIRHGCGHLTTDQLDRPKTWPSLTIAGQFHDPIVHIMRDHLELLHIGDPAPLPFCRRHIAVIVNSARSQPPGLF